MRGHAEVVLRSSPDFLEININYRGNFGLICGQGRELYIQFVCVYM